MEEKLMPRIDFTEYCEDKYIIDLSNYEIKKENGKTYAVRKQSKYPKTYEECCKALFPNSIELGKVLTSGYNCEKLKKFGELLICRDAYWKIAGEQMGLGKPWVLPFHERQNDEPIYFIVNKLGEIYTDSANIIIDNRILAFPTEEMRDYFYENFKELIEKCKYFL